MSMYYQCVKTHSFLLPVLGSREDVPWIYHFHISFELLSLHLNCTCLYSPPLI